MTAVDQQANRRQDLTIFVTGPVDDAQVAAIRAAVPRGQVVYAVNLRDVEADLGSADVLALAPPQLGVDSLAAATRAGWIHLWAAGVDLALTPQLLANQALLTCSKGNGAIPLAEHALMLMLMLNRDVRRSLRAQDERTWEPFRHGEVNGLTCGVIGLGNSGADFAGKAKACHMRVLGMRRSTQPLAAVDELFSRDRLPEMLARCDVVVVTAPLTKETAGLFGVAEFRAMKPTAHFINISRGGIVDDTALLRSLNEGWIGGAGIDAHGVEPLPPDSPFWTAPNTVITPHNGSSTDATRARGVEIFLRNLERYLAGRELDNLVDKDAGY